jgi:hypothetical protein
MRLPMFRTPAAPQWRIGHLHRRMPEGYFESAVTQENRILHPGLRAYYENLAVALRAPLGDAARWRALWALWTGEFDAGLRAYVATDYMNPPLVTVPAAELAIPHPPDAILFTSRSLRCVYPGGLLVRLPEPRTVTTAHLRIVSTVTVTVTFVGRDGESAPVTVAPTDGDSLSFHPRDVAVPNGAAVIEAVRFTAPLALTTGKYRLAVIGSVTFE